MKVLFGRLIWSPAIVIASLATVAVVVAKPPIGALSASHVDNPGDGHHTTTDGVRVVVLFEPTTHSLHAFVQRRDGRRAPLGDGSYKLANGGAIRVSGGRIVWDAFGVIDKLNRGIPVEMPGNNAG